MSLLYQVTLPAPPTLNLMYRYVGSRVLKSKPYRQWLADCDVLMLNEQWIDQVFDEVSVSILGRPVDKRIRDVDSYAKPILDLLELRVLDNDRQVRVLHVERAEPLARPQGHTVVVSVSRHAGPTTAT